VNGYEIEIDYCYPFRYVYWEHSTLFHTPKFELYNMEKGLLKNEWIHVEFKLRGQGYWNLSLSEEDKNKILSRVQMGIHVLMEKSNTEEENVIFTDPRIRKTKVDEYLNASLSLSQKKLKRKKFSIRLNPKFSARFRKQKEHWS